MLQRRMKKIILALIFLDKTIKASVLTAASAPPLEGENGNPIGQTNDGLYPNFNGLQDGPTSAHNLFYSTNLSQNGTTNSLTKQQMMDFQNPTISPPPYSSNNPPQYPFIDPSYSSNNPPQYPLIDPSYLPPPYEYATSGNGQFSDDSSVNKKSLHSDLLLEFSEMTDDDSDIKNPNNKKKGKKGKNTKKSDKNIEISEEDNEILKSFENFKSAIDFKVKEAHAYHKLLFINGVSKKPIYHLYDDALMKIFNKLISFLEKANFDQISRKNILKKHIEALLGPFKADIFLVNKPFAIFPGFKNGDKAFSTVLAKIKENITENDPVSKGYLDWIFSRINYRQSSEGSKKTEKLRKSIEIFNNFIGYFDNDKSKNLIPFSKICSYFVSYLDALYKLRIFSEDKDRENVNLILKSIYTDLIKLNHILPAILKHKSDSEGQPSKKMTKFNFLKGQFSDLHKSFNVNTLTLFELINFSDSTPKFFTFHIYRTLSILRSINALFRLFHDIISREQALNIKKSKDFLDVLSIDLTFFVSNITLFNIESSFVMSPEFNSFLVLPLTVEKKNGSVMTKIPLIGHYFKSKDDNIHPKDTDITLRSCDEILKPFEGLISQIGSLYIDNNIDKTIKDKEKSDENKKLHEMMLQKHPELVKDYDLVLDKMLEFLLAITGKNLSSIKSTVLIPVTGPTKALEIVKRALDGADMRKFRLKEIMNDIYESASRLLNAENNTPEIGKFKVDSIKDVFDLIYRRYTSSGFSARERDYLVELGILDMKCKLATIMVCILIFFDGILLILWKVSKKSSSRTKRIYNRR